jgi:hypothetical protein
MLSDYVKFRLFLARKKALEKAKEKHKVDKYMTVKVL